MPQLKQALGAFFTGRATGEELTEGACQRRVGCLARW